MKKPTDSSLETPPSPPTHRLPGTRGHGDQARTDRELGEPRGRGHQGRGTEARREAPGCRSGERKRDSCGGKEMKTTGTGPAGGRDGEAETKSSGDKGGAVLDSQDRPEPVPGSHTAPVTCRTEGWMGRSQRSDFRPSFSFSSLTQGRMLNLEALTLPLQSEHCHTRVKASS